MATPNFPGPYEVEFTYTVTGITHTARLNCDVSGTPTPGDLPATIDLKLRSGGTVQLDTAVIAWINLIKFNFFTGVTFDNFTLWKYTAGTFDRIFISTGAIALIGTSAVATNLSHMDTSTFRTIEGNGMKLVFMESVNVSISRIPYAAVGVPTKAVFDFVTSTLNWILARDTSYPIAPLNFIGGQNEATFRSRNR